MRHSPISLENGPLKSVQNVKKWPIGNFKIIKKSYGPLARNLFPITEDSMAGLQSKFQNINAKINQINQNVDRQTDIINP